MKYFNFDVAVVLGIITLIALAFNPIRRYFFKRRVQRDREEYIRATCERDKGSLYGEVGE